MLVALVVLDESVVAALVVVGFAAVQGFVGKLGQCIVECVEVVHE